MIFRYSNYNDSSSIQFQFRDLADDDVVNIVYINVASNNTIYIIINLNKINIDINETVLIYIIWERYQIDKIKDVYTTFDTSTQGNTFLRISRIPHTVAQLIITPNSNPL